MTGDKPWERRRPHLPNPYDRTDPQRRTSPDSSGKRPGANPPPIPGIDAARRPMPTPPAIENKRQNSSKVKGLASVTAIFLVALVAFFATKNSNGENQRSTSAPIENTTATSTTVTKNVASLNQWEDLATSVVYIEAEGSACGWTGSGSIVLDGSYVLTNQHVAGSGECDLKVAYTSSTDIAPDEFVDAQVLVSDEAIDLAVLRLVDSSGNPLKNPNHKALEIDDAPLKLGDKIYTLGYPGVGGSTVTLTSGDYSGMERSDTEFYKTTANMNPGVSGGTALSVSGKLIGVPTAGVLDPETKQRVGLNLIRPISYAKALLDKALTVKEPMVVQESALGGSSDTYEESSADPIFDTCAKAKRNGYGPYYQGSDYEYDFYDDRDNDGVVCE